MYNVAHQLSSSQTNINNDPRDWTGSHESLDEHNGGGEHGQLSPTGGNSTSKRNPWGNQSYSELITQAILSSPRQRATLAQGTCRVTGHHYTHTIYSIRMVCCQYTVFP